MTDKREQDRIEAGEAVKPVAWMYERKDRRHVYPTRQQAHHPGWTETPLYAHPPADAEPVALLRDIVDEVRDPDGAGTLPTDLMVRIDAHLADKVQS